MTGEVVETQLTCWSSPDRQLIVRITAVNGGEVKLNVRRKVQNDVGHTAAGETSEWKWAVLCGRRCLSWETRSSSLLASCERPGDPQEGVEAVYAMLMGNMRGDGQNHRKSTVNGFYSSCNSEENERRTVIQNQYVTAAGKRATRSHRNTPERTAGGKLNHWCVNVPGGQINLIHIYFTLKYCLYFIYTTETWELLVYTCVFTDCSQTHRPECRANPSTGTSNFTKPHSETSYEQTNWFHLDFLGNNSPPIRTPDQVNMKEQQQEVSVK